MGELVLVFSPNFLYEHELIISLSIYPHRYSHTISCFNVQFNDFVNTIFFSPPTVALIVAVFLDNTLDYKDSARDRGMPWWVKFRTFKGDSRNEEFYTLPFNLNRFFPPSWIEGWNRGKNKVCLCHQIKMASKMRSIISRLRRFFDDGGSEEKRRD